MDVTSFILGSIAGAKSASGLRYLVVQELPEVGQNNVIYLVPKTTSKTNNYYDEYMYINSAWELIGDTEVDLSDYLKEEDLKTINGNSIVGSGNLEIEAPSNYLGKTSLYNTQGTALNLNDLPVGVYILKHNSNNNKLWLQATYKLNASAEPTTQYLEIDLFDDLNTTTGKVNTRIVLNELLLYIDSPVSEETEGTVSGKNIGSLTITINDKKRNLANNFKTIVLRTAGMAIGNNTYEDFNVVQYSTLPTTSADNVNKVVQYIGTTDANYTNGYFYQCVGTESGGTTTYSWENINVQGSSSGGRITTITQDTNVFDLDEGYYSLEKNTYLYFQKNNHNNYYLWSNNDSFTGIFMYVGPVWKQYGTTNTKSFYLYIPQRNLVSTSIIPTSTASSSRYGVLINGYVQENHYYDVSTQFLFSVSEPAGTTVSDFGELIGSVKTYAQYNNTNFKNYGIICKGTLENVVAGKNLQSLTDIYQLAGLSEYSSSSTYAVGDYVYYNDLIYKCNTAVSTAEAFDSNKWTQKTYMEYMSDTLVGTALQGNY